jgi:DNA replication protein DnaC
MSPAAVVRTKGAAPATRPSANGTTQGTTPVLDALASKLTALGLDYPATVLPELLEQAARESLSPTAFLDLVLTGELERKDERRVTTMLKLSGLPAGKTLEDFDWSFQPRADRRQIEALATCSYLRERTNILFLGPPGVGKSHLAAALGVQAIKNGFSVAHFVLDDLMHVLRADAAVPPARLRAKRYFNCALLIIDEVGFRPLDRMEANLFFRLVSARYERGSIMLTSNKHVRDWPEIFAGDEILTTAILDRLLHHVAVVHIDGRSYRLRELGALLAPRSDASSTGAPGHPTPRSGGSDTD